MKTFVKVNQIFCSIIFIINMIIAFKANQLTREANQLRDIINR